MWENRATNIFFCDIMNSKSVVQFFAAVFVIKTWNFWIVQRLRKSLKSNDVSPKNFGVDVTKFSTHNY